MAASAMESRQKNRIEELLLRSAAEFLSRESNRLSMITVTGLRASEELGQVTFLVSVFPDERQEEALGFLMRQRGELRDYIKGNVRLRRIPHIEFELDRGEKHRREIEEII